MWFFLITYISVDIFCNKMKQKYSVDSSQFSDFGKFLQSKQAQKRPPKRPKEWGLFSLEVDKVPAPYALTGEQCRSGVPIRDFNYLHLTYLPLNRIEQEASGWINELAHYG